MKVVFINPSPVEQKTAVAKLQDDLQDVIHRFKVDNGEMPVAYLVGVLRIVERNLIESI